MQTYTKRDGLLRRIIKVAETDEDARTLAKEMAALSLSAEQWLDAIDRRARARLRELGLPDTWAPTKQHPKGLVEYGDDKLPPEARSIKACWGQVITLRQARAAGDIDTAIIHAARLQLLLTNHDAALAHQERRREEGKQDEAARLAKAKEERLAKMRPIVGEMLARNPNMSNEAIARCIKRELPEFDLSIDTLRTDYIPLVRLKKKT